MSILVQLTPGAGAVGVKKTAQCHPPFHRNVHLINFALVWQLVALAELPNCRIAEKGVAMPALSIPSLLAAVLGCLACCGAHATLGGAPSDFSNAAAVRARQLSAVPAAGASAASAASSYSIKETTLDSGTVVREYVGAGGAVFAVAWSGPFMPDLRTLLGAQFATLTAENAARPRGRRGQLRVARADVVIESGGHMRAWSGRAWLTGALPAGVDSAVIE
jgi:hypothetical protein